MSTSHRMQRGQAAGGVNILSKKNDKVSFDGYIIFSAIREHSCYCRFSVKSENHIFFCYTFIIYGRSRFKEANIWEFFKKTPSMKIF